MSWTAFHSRGETLRAVIDAANAHQDGILPMQVPGVAENFADETDLVGALLLKWHARLSGNIERVLTREPMNLEAAVAAAWRTTAEQMPGVRLVIDHCLQSPGTTEMAEAMERAQESEWARLAQAAGLANGHHVRDVGAGRRVEELARAGHVTGEPDTTTQSKETPVKHLRKHRAGDTPKTRCLTDETRAHENPAEETSTESFVDRIKAALAA